MRLLNLVGIALVFLSAAFAVLSFTPFGKSGRVGISEGVSNRRVILLILSVCCLVISYVLRSVSGYLQFYFS